MSIIEEKTLLKSGDSLGNEIIHYPITKQDCISDLVSDRCVTYIIGTTLSGHTLADCDFLCTGSSDQIIINSAIQSLGEYGGEIVLLQGKYSTTGQISLVSNLTFRGVGFVEIDRNNNGQTENTTYCIFGGQIENLKLLGISIINSRIGLQLSSSINCIVENCSFSLNSTHGLCLNSSSYCIVRNCISFDNNSNGIYFYLSKNCTSCNNNCFDNENGLSVAGGEQHIVEGNICKDNLSMDINFGSLTIGGTSVFTCNCLIIGNLITKDISLPSLAINNTIASNHVYVGVV